MRLNVKSCRLGSKERQRPNIYIDVRVGGIGEWGQVVRIDDREHGVGGKGGWAGTWRILEWERRRFYLGFSFSLFISRSRYASRLAGPVVDTNGFETVIRLCKVNVRENAGGSGSRLGAKVSDLRT